MSYSHKVAAYVCSCCPQVQCTVSCITNTPQPTCQKDRRSDSTLQPYGTELPRSCWQTCTPELTALRIRLFKVTGERQADEGLEEGGGTNNFIVFAFRRLVAVPSSTEIHVSSQTTGGHGDTVGSFSPRTAVSSCQCTSTNPPYSYFIHLLPTLHNICH